MPFCLAPKTYLFKLFLDNALGWAIGSPNPLSVHLAADLPLVWPLEDGRLLRLPLDRARRMMDCLAELYDPEGLRRYGRLRRPGRARPYPLSVTAEPIAKRGWTVSSSTPNILMSPV
jgi:hypothetical protein